MTSQHPEPALEGPFIVDIPPSTFHFIIPNASNTHVLVARPIGKDPTATRCHLPFVSPPTDDENIPAVLFWDASAGELSAVMLHFLGLQIYVRDLVWRNPNLSFDCEENILVADLVEPTVVPPAFFWASLEEVNKIEWKNIHAAVKIPKLVARVLYVSATLPANGPQDEKGNGAHYELPVPPWRQPGWFVETERWFINTVNQTSLKLHREGRLMQLQNLYWSTLLQYPLETAARSDLPKLFSYMRASEHYLFLKSSCPSIPEATLTKSVACHFPDLVPKILAIRDECTFIQIGVVSRISVPPEIKLETLAQMQIESLACLESLRTDGIPYHGVDWHAKHIVHMLQHPALTPVRAGKAYANILKHVNYIRTLFAELAAYNIPHTLIHGDFSASNVLTDPADGHSLRFVDWATACIGHPFIDFLRFTVVDDDQPVDEAAKKIYTSRFEHFESKENIARALDIAYLVMLWENLGVLLKMFESAGLKDREHLLSTLEERLAGMSYTLNKRRRSRLNYLDKSEAVSTLIISKNCGHLMLAKRMNQNLTLPVISPFQIEGHAVTDRDVDGHGMHLVVKSHFGLDTRVVRSLWLQPDDENARQKSALVLEALDDAHVIPSGYEWVSESATKYFSEDRGREQSVVATFFAKGLVQFVAPAQIPWRHFGWLSRTSEWASEVMFGSGVRKEGSFQEVSTNLFSTVWKILMNSTEEHGFGGVSVGINSFFLKTSLHSQKEGNVLSIIFEFADGLVPSVVAVHPKLNTFLMTDMGHVDKHNMDWFLLFRGLGQLQLRSIEHVDRLVEAGLQRYDCDWVSRNSEELLRRSYAFLGQGRATGRESAASDIVRYMEELEIFKLPLTLVHGDFHIRNIGKRSETGYGIYDWSSACVGLPFCDIAVMTKLSEKGLIDEEESRKGYQSGWGGKIIETNFDRILDLTLVYYWILNIESLLKLTAEVAVVESDFMKRLISDTLHSLDMAIQGASGSKE